MKKIYAFLKIFIFSLLAGFIFSSCDWAFGGHEDIWYSVDKKINDQEYTFYIMFSESTNYYSADDGSSYTGDCTTDGESTADNGEDSSAGENTPSEKSSYAPLKSTAEGTSYDDKKISVPAGISVVIAPTAKENYGKYTFETFLVDSKEAHVFFDKDGKEVSVFMDKGIIDSFVASFRFNKTFTKDDTLPSVLLDESKKCDLDNLGDSTLTWGEVANTILVY